MRSCGTSERPGFFHKKSLTALTHDENTRVIVPVVFHVLGTTAIQTMVSEGRLYAQLKQLNRDFATTNPDFNNTPGPFQALKQNGARISFELNRIIRKTTSKVFDAAINNGDDIKLPSQGGSAAVDTSKNLNVWIGNVDPYLGWATFPWWRTPNASNPVDGVVVHYGTVGNSFLPSTYAPFAERYDIGRTLTHEVGHYFGMRHMWYDYASDYESAYDDHSTCGRSLPTHPAQKGANGNKPMFPHNANACPAGPSSPPAQYGNLFMDYMDYVDDDSMHLFSQEQMEQAMEMAIQYRPSMVKQFTRVATSTLNLSGLTSANDQDVYKCIVTSEDRSEQVISNGVRVRHSGPGGRSGGLEFEFPNGIPDWAY